MSKKEPDGYFRRDGFGGQWDIKDGHYVDELMGREDYKAYEPVYFVTEPPVSKEVLEWVEKTRISLREMEHVCMLLGRETLAAMCRVILMDIN